MSFRDWLFSNTPEGSEVNGAWKLPHILTLVGCIAVIILFAFVFRKKEERTRKIVVRILIGLILFFEIARRVINFIRGSHVTLNDYLYTLLPRPWCAISCWAMIVAMFANKKFLWNFACTSSFLCALIFFAYPEAGFTNKYVAFEHLYSIGTHSLLLVGSITLITLKFTDFDYKTAWKEGICLAVIYAYAFLEIYLLDIASDPLYFMPNGDVAKVLGNMPYGLYLPLYLVFVSVYFSAFYFITYLARKKRAKQP